MTDIVPGGDFFAAPRTGAQPTSGPPAFGTPPTFGPPPASGQPGGYSQPVVNHFGMIAPAGPVPPTQVISGGSPPARTAVSGDGYGAVPELVTVAYTLLGMFAIGGLLVAMTVASVLSDTQGITSTGNGLGSGFIWGGSGLLGCVLVFALRKGAKGAQVGATVLAGLWTLYWSYYALKVWSSVAGNSGFSGVFGATGTVGSIAMFVLLAMSGAVGALLWTPSAKQHFS